MTDEQREHLARRLKEAAEQQPEILKLRSSLLGNGGIELVAPPRLDSDVPNLLDCGAVIEGTTVCHILDESGCHENVAELWREGVLNLTAIGTGYALSEDGLWRQHSWGIRPGEIIETTEERVKYFGRLLTGSEADAFAEANQGDPEERRWSRLPEIWFRLDKDEDGYPPKDWERLKAEPTGQPHIFRVKSVPFFAREVAYNDEVCWCVSPEGYEPVFESVVKRSGYSTLRLLIAQDEDRASLTNYFTDRDCLVEFSGRLVAIGVPNATLDEVSEYIDAEKERGRWGAEDGYIAAN